MTPGHAIGYRVRYRCRAQRRDLAVAGFRCHYSFSRRGLWNLFPTLYLRETITRQEALLRTLECWQGDNSAKCRRKEVHMTEGAAASISFSPSSNPSRPLLPILTPPPLTPPGSGIKNVYCRAKAEEPQRSRNVH